MRAFGAATLLGDWYGGSLDQSSGDTDPGLGRQRTEHRPCRGSNIDTPQIESVTAANRTVLVTMTCAHASFDSSPGRSAGGRGAG
jgi:hypothetical protein